MTITIADGRGALWQWDTGRRVKITDGADVKQIHYQNRCFGCSVDVDVEDDGTAIIPDELLQDYHTLTAYAYVTDDAGGYTKVQQDFAVYKRAKPADYVYTPTERAGFDKLRAEIGELSALQTNAKNNLVAAINEAAASESMGITGATVGQIAKITAVDESGVPTAWEPVDMPSGGSPDAVLYTAQTLTDAQKKQARDNIDAAGEFVTAITLYENDPERASFDKTFDEISAAVSAGKRVFARVQYEGLGDVEYYPLTAYSPFGLDFFRANSYGYGIDAYTISLNAEGIGTVRYEKAVTLNSDKSMPQQTMASAPTKDMHIATKKYVDDSVAGAGGGSVPKPLTYDYMPEGYPKKMIGTVTVMEEQELAFALMEAPIYAAMLQSPLEIVEGKTYAVKWDGNEYECVCVVSEAGPAFGNLSIMGSGDDTGEPFVYVYNTNRAAGLFGTLDTSASHTISVKTTAEVITPMAAEFLPNAPAAANSTTVFYTFGEPIKLKHADGTAVTAQEAYDAFMNKRVLIVKDVATYEAISMGWYDNNSAQDNPNAVGFVKLEYVFKGADGSVSLAAIDVGDSSLVPAPSR